MTEAPELPIIIPETERDVVYPARVWEQDAQGLWSSRAATSADLQERLVQAQEWQQRGLSVAATRKGLQR